MTTACGSRDECGVLLESEVATGEGPEPEDSVFALLDGRNGGAKGVGCQSAKGVPVVLEVVGFQL